MRLSGLSGPTRLPLTGQCVFRSLFIRKCRTRNALLLVIGPTVPACDPRGHTPLFCRFGLCFFSWVPHRPQSDFGRHGFPKNHLSLWRHLFMVLTYDFLESPFSFCSGGFASLMCFQLCCLSIRFFFPRPFLPAARTPPRHTVASIIECG